MNFVLGVLNKKGEEEVSNKIYFVLKEGTTNDSVIHPINLEEPIGGGDDPKLPQEVDRDCD